MDIISLSFAIAHALLGDDREWMASRKALDEGGEVAAEGSYGVEFADVVDVFSRAIRQSPACG